MSTESNSLDFLRELMARQGVEPSSEDLRAVLAFVDAVLPELERLEATLPAETPP
jgi:hypothetical protein